MDVRSPHVMTEHIELNESKEGDEIEDLEVLRDLEELKQFVNEQEREHKKKIQWGST